MFEQRLTEQKNYCVHAYWGWMMVNLFRADTQEGTKKNPKKFMSSKTKGSEPKRTQNMIWFGDHF